MSEILFWNFQLLVCCGLLHQLPVTEISDPFCHRVPQNTLASLSNYHTHFPQLYCLTTPPPHCHNVSLSSCNSHFPLLYCLSTPMPQCHNASLSNCHTLFPLRYCLSTPMPQCHNASLSNSIRASHYAIASLPQCRLSIRAHCHNGICTHSHNCSTA
jgi:hypothetical protein